MRSSAALSLLLLNACIGRRDVSGSDGAVAEADADRSAHMYARSGSSVIVGATTVVWGLGPAACPLEVGDCPPVAPTVLSSTSPADVPAVWASTRPGVDIVGDQDEVFFLNTTDSFGTFVVRVRTIPNSSPQGMSVPHLDVSGLAVDATYVYWSEGGVNGFTIMRAARSGDGADAQSVTTCAFRPSGMFVFGGYLIVGNLRVPVTGGTLQPFTSEENVGVFAIGSDRLYIEQYLPPNGYKVRISSLTVDGVTETLADDLEQWESPHLGGAYDQGELFWTTTLARLYRMPAGGGTPTESASNVSSPIGLSPQSILFNFTADGYSTIPR